MGERGGSKIDAYRKPSERRKMPRAGRPAHGRDDASLIVKADSADAAAPAL